MANGRASPSQTPRTNFDRRDPLAKALPQDKTVIICTAYSLQRELAVLATRFVFDPQFAQTGFFYCKR